MTDFACGLLVALAVVWTLYSVRARWALYEDVKRGTAGERLVLRCGGCDTVMGMVEPSEAAYQDAPWAFCSWVCLEDVVAKAKEETTRCDEP